MIVAALVLLGLAILLIVAGIVLKSAAWLLVVATAVTILAGIFAVTADHRER